MQHLCDLGLLLREADPVDGRAMLISASPDAVHRMQAIDGERRRWLAEQLAEWSEDDLREFVDGSFDTVLAVDTFPYLNQSGTALVESYFDETERVLKSRGDFVILNYSYRGDDDADKRDVAHMAKAYGFDVIVSGERPFSIWDGSAFHLKKRR